MRIPAIHLKLLREMARLKGQVATIAMVLAGGLTCFIALRGTYASLATACVSYYDSSGFAHVFAPLKRAPDSLTGRIERIAGVAIVQTRIVQPITLPLEGMARPAYARLISLPAEQASINRLHLEAGRLPLRGRGDEVALLSSFAKAHGLGVGDRLPAVIHGKLKKLRITALVLSPEYVYAIRPGALIDDPARFTALWMDHATLAAAYRLEGSFNDVVLRLAPGASDVAVRAALDRMLTPYGGAGAISRDDQISNRIVTQELNQLRALAGMVPAVFLGVTAFLVNLVLGRLIRLQRAEIAALKAIGYRNRELAVHYLGLVFCVLVPGSALGVFGGQLLGSRVFALYAALFRFPSQRFTISFALAGAGIVISALAAAAGALLAVRAAVRLPPAEAMRPPAPAQYRRGLAERLRLGPLLGTSGLMMLRELERRPLRTLLSSLGIAGAVALLVLGRFGIDSLDSYLLNTYQREQRHSLAVTFVDPVAPRVVHEIGRIEGVIRAEGLRQIGARASHDHRQRDVLVLGLPEGASLRRVIERSGRAVQVPEAGVLASRMLGQALDLRVGDRLELLLREGGQPHVRATIVGFVDDTTGLQVYAPARLLAAVQHDVGAVSSVLLQVDAQRVADVERQLRRSPFVIDISDLPDEVQRLREMNGSIMDVWTLVSVTLSACIIFGVVYNNARISLETQSRELSSLRVLGFSRREVSAILISALALEVGLAIPLGLLLGRVWGTYFMESSLDPEDMRWRVVIESSTYALSACVALLAAAASALWVRRSLDRLDLIAVLKTRE